MQAVLHESQRMASTVPLSVFHCTTKDTELMGYSIPEVGAVWTVKATGLEHRSLHFLSLFALWLRIFLLLVISLLTRSGIQSS